MADLNSKRPQALAFDYPDWQPEYRAAILETDRARLKEKIDAAENGHIPPIPRTHDST